MWSCVREGAGTPAKPPERLPPGSHRGGGGGELHPEPLLGVGWVQKPAVAESPRFNAAGNPNAGWKGEHWPLPLLNLPSCDLDM